jgi:hypothetical protein
LRNVAKRRTPVRRSQPSFFEYVFDGGPNNKVCLHGATRIRLSGGTSFKRRTPVRGIQPSFFEYAFDGGPNSKVCLHGAIRIGLSGGSSFLGGIGGCGRRRGRAAAIGIASWCDAHPPVGGIFVFLAGSGGSGRRRGSATATHDAKEKTTPSSVQAAPPTDETKVPRKQVPKRRTPVRRTQPSFFEYVFHA